MMGLPWWISECWKAPPLQCPVSALQGRSTVARYSRCPMQIWGCSPSAGRMCPAWSSMHLNWPDSDGFPTSARGEHRSALPSAHPPCIQLHHILRSTSHSSV